MKNDYNEEIILDQNSFVFLDSHTKGHKTLQKILTKRNIQWTNEPNEAVTHIVCTRYAKYSNPPEYEIIYNPKWDSVPDNIKEQFKNCQRNHVDFRSKGTRCIGGGFHMGTKMIRWWDQVDVSYNGINKFIQDKSWKLLPDIKIYSYKEFKRALDNSSRKQLEDENDGILTLLQSKDDANVELAIEMIRNYKMDNRWIPWLWMHSSNREVRKFLRELGMTPPTTTYWYGDKIGRQYDRIIEILNETNVPKEYRLDFIKDLFNVNG